MADAALRRRRVRLLQKYLLNPPIKLAAWAGLTPGYTLLETTGRHTGRTRRTAVGLHLAGGSGWIVAEQGRHAGYVANLRADPQVRLRLDRTWFPATAHVLGQDDPQARLDSFDRPAHAAAVRRFGTELLTIRLDPR
ncbi:nitroreductase family deazaflavin-dependent oxidoreductase [Salinifilum aidingensis]